MYNPTIVEAIAKQRTDERMREAQAMRLHKQLRAGKPNLTEHALGKLGDLLVEAGERLQESQAPAEGRRFGWTGE